MADLEESILFFILAHHDKQHLNRCLRFSFKNKEIFLCARCTSILIGFLVHLTLLLTVLNFNVFIGSLLLFFLPLPSVTDWITQSLGYRESVNRIRVSTGLLLGSDWAYRLLRFLNSPSDPWFLLSSASYLFTVLAVASISIKKEKGSPLTLLMK